MIEAISLKKSFFLDKRKIPVLRDLNFTIKTGERIAICGESGTGKSTLLQIIGSLDKPCSGTIKIFGADIFTKSESELANWRNQALGFVFQFHHLLPEFTALENVMTPALINGESNSTAKKKATRLLEKVGLSKRLKHKPGELSGGEQQRAAVARALVNRPSMVLADEPTGNLDARTAASVQDLFLDLNETHGTTFLIVTHNREMASRFHRRFQLRDGVLHQER
ncbi:ABC transporter ATP-binding protein [bacterium]|nr:ABC transporter ATP-binding protein [bacterium]